MESNKIEDIELDLDIFLIDYLIQINILNDTFKDTLREYNKLVNNSLKLNDLLDENKGTYLSKRIRKIYNGNYNYDSMIDVNLLLDFIQLEYDRGWNYIINNKRYNSNNFSNKLNDLISSPEIIIKILMCSFQSIFYHSYKYLLSIFFNKNTKSEFIVADVSYSKFNVFVNIDTTDNKITLNIEKVYKITDMNRNVLKLIRSNINIDLINNKYKVEFIVFPNISIVENYLPNLINRKENINQVFKLNLSKPNINQGYEREWSYFFFDKTISNNDNPKNIENFKKKIKIIYPSKELEIKYLVSQIETLETLTNILKLNTPFNFLLINYKKKFFYKHDDKIYFNSYYIYKIGNPEEEIVLFNMHVYQILNITDNILERYIVYEVLDKFIDNLNIKRVIRLKLEYVNDRNLITQKILDYLVQFYSNEIVTIKLNEIFKKIRLENSVKPVNNNINTFLNNITQTLPMLNKNKQSSKKKSDFLFISFNEAEKIYDYTDCLPIIIKVFNENPTVIVICTQDSLSNRISNNHYQRVLGHILDELEYEIIEKIDGSNTVEKTSKKILRVFSSMIHGDKGIRTRIYIKKIIKDKFTSVSTKFSFGKISNRTLYNSAILTILTLPNKKKFAIINCDLFYEHHPGTGLNKRIEQFREIVKYFNLIKLNEDHDIFFCGDMNFRSFTYTNKECNIGNINYKECSHIKSRNIIKKYLTNKTSLIESNELFFFLKNESNSMNGEEFVNMKLPNKQNQTFEHKKIFYENLLKSMNYLGTHLTSKYFTNQYKHQIYLYKTIYNENSLYRYKNIVNERINSYFNIRPKKDNNIRVPSQTDRILYSLTPDTSIEISKEDFNVHLFPDKSDHKMISLTFNFNSRNMMDDNQGVPLNVAINSILTSLNIGEGPL